MMDEEKIIEMLRREGEALEIPESLSPKEIEKKITGKQKKSKTNRYFYGKMLAGLAGAACLTLGLYSVWQSQGLENHQSEMAAQSEKQRMTEPELALEPELQSAEEPALNANSYKEIYKVLEEAEQYTYNSFYYITPDESAFADGAASAEPEAVKSEAAFQETAFDYSTTNLRTEGVDEADIIKNDGNYLYALLTEKGKRNIYILRAEGEKLTFLSEITGLSNAAEFYLAGNQLIVLERYWQEPDKMLPVEGGAGICIDGDMVFYQNGETKIHIYDISDKKTPKLVKSLSQSGNYESSRIKDGVLYTFSRFYPQTGDEKNWNAYIPMAQGELIREDCIYMPDTVEESSYLVMTALPLDNPEKFSDKKAVLSAGSNYYISQKNIYVYRQKFTEEQKHETKIWRYAYGDGRITENGNQTLPGGIDDSFSIDEYQGWLRVLTCEQRNMLGETTNALYVLDENLEVKGQLTDLAKGERIYSARFLGDMVYFVTFRQMDPLFSVDLSNPEKPELLGELKITGFSEYLHFYGENLLLGIGREADPETGENKGVKLSMFDISDSYDVKERKKTVLSEYLYSTAFDDYRNVLISPEKNIIGFTAGEDYFVYSYEEDRGFVEKLHIKDASLTSGMEYQTVRGAFIKDTFYLIKGSEGVEAYDLNNNKKTGDWKL